MKTKKFTWLIVLYASYAWFSKVSSAIIPVYLLQRGVSIEQMFLANALQFIPMILMLIFIRVTSAKLSWRLAIITLMLGVFSITQLHFTWQPYLPYVAGGIALALFFVYYNIAHFLYTPKNRTGVSGGIMYAVGPAISIFAPILAGYLAATNISYLWMVSIASCLLAFYLTFKQTDLHINYNLLESLQAIKSTRVPIFLEGIWESVLFAFIPLSTLHFITTPAGYGQYLGYLSLVGTIAGLLLGHLTDKLGKRSVYLTPICLALSIATLALGYGLNSLTIWIVVTSAIQFLVPIFWNITTALVVDQSSDLKVVFPGRELVLALGRSLGLLWTYLCIVNSQLNLLLITLALTIALLPAYVYYQSKITHRFTYL